MSWFHHAVCWELGGSLCHTLPTQLVNPWFTLVSHLPIPPLHRPLRPPPLGPRHPLRPPPPPPQCQPRLVHTWFTCGGGRPAQAPPHPQGAKPHRTACASCGRVCGGGRHPATCGGGGPEAVGSRAAPRQGRPSRRPREVPGPSPAA